MRQIGWDACQLIGGYKPYRNFVLRTLAELPPDLRWRVVCGPTGSGKTALLGALAARGEQVLDLEELASHRGSVLGAIPGRPQPSQKAFETAIAERLLAFEPERSIYVEAESRKIGRLQVPESLIQIIRSSTCVVIEASLEARITFLLRDYAHLGKDRATLLDALGSLSALHSRETLARWQVLVVEGRIKELLGELLSRHYDPLYAKSQKYNFERLAQASTLKLARLDPDSLDDAAERLLAYPD
jgi:tRNA 2-selenouridine synthase